MSGSKRRLKPSITLPPWRSTVWAALRALAMSRSIGFSQSTALPSATAASSRSIWVSVGVPITTASMSLRVSTAAQS
ncbi:Uncharacterised protein [Mycobacterium tuberculosis]|nr:Uncharacterised protein [Mycobacterium tuberculosis]